MQKANTIFGFLGRGYTTTNCCSWHKGLVVGLYGSFRYGPSFEHRQTGLAPCGYGNGDGKVTLGELQTYLDDEMTYQARRRYNRDQKASVQGKLDSVLATLR